MIRLHLPFPPSVNNLFANKKGGKGRFKTERYKAWQALASVAIKDAHKQGIQSYSIHICLRRPDKRRRDLANAEKAISDLLVEHGVLADDSGCERLTMQWGANLPAECVVLIQPSEEALAA